MAPRLPHLPAIRSGMAQPSSSRPRPASTAAQAATAARVDFRQGAAAPTPTGRHPPQPCSARVVGQTVWIFPSFSATRGGLAWQAASVAPERGWNVLCLSHHRQVAQTVAGC